MKSRIRIIYLFLCLLSAQALFAQRDTLKITNKKHLKLFIVSSSVVYGASLIALNELWYKNAPSQSFHFFNDNAEWKQVDKVGHFFSSYYLSYGTSKALSWCNISEKKAALWGAASGVFVMLPIEVFDGFSSAYGASVGDALANATGAAFFLGQSILWNEQRIKPKFSFHQTQYAALRPNVLGENFAHEILKDYNGQTYWFSIDMDKFITFPKWLNLAVGYGANGMVFSRDTENSNAGYQAYRQFYFAIDFDLKSINTHSKTLKTLFSILDLIKLPAPTLEFSTEGTRLRPFYF